MVKEFQRLLTAPIFSAVSVSGHCDFNLFPKYLLFLNVTRKSMPNTYSLKEATCVFEGGCIVGADLFDLEQHPTYMTKVSICNSCL